MAQLIKFTLKGSSLTQNQYLPKGKEDLQNQNCQQVFRDCFDFVRQYVHGVHICMIQVNEIGV